MSDEFRLQLVKAEEEKIKRARHAKKVARMLEDGFSRVQAEEFLGVGIKPVVNVVTVYDRDLGCYVLHPEEKKWLDHFGGQE
ncbi:MAG: hypothetical protein WDZ40_02465 [Candidatus Spechtbacterales bacterium]